MHFIINFDVILHVRNSSSLINHLHNHHQQQTPKGNNKFQNHISHKRQTTNHIMTITILNIQSSLINYYLIISSWIQSQLQVIPSTNLNSTMFVYYPNVHLFLSNSPKTTFMFKHLNKAYTHITYGCSNSYISTS